MKEFWIYLGILVGTTYLLRALPFALMKQKIKNRFIRSFLYYVPYVTLSVMTFPAIIHATKSPLTGGAALLLGIVAAWFKAGLFPVAILCCVTVFILEFFI